MFHANQYVELMMAEGIERRRYAGFRRDDAAKEVEASIERVWDARERTLGIAAHKLGFWVMSQWFLKRTINAYRQWYLNMRSEQGSLKLLYLLIRLHRDYMRSQLIFPWRVESKRDLSEKENAYMIRRANQRNRPPRREGKADITAGDKAHCRLELQFHD